jgi:hypothetical protein
MKGIQFAIINMKNFYTIKNKKTKIVKVKYELLTGKKFKLWFIMKYFKQKRTKRLAEWLKR